MHYHRGLSLITTVGLMAGCQDQQTAITAPDPLFALSEENLTDLKITFLSYRDGNYEVYAMDRTGGKQTRLTNNPLWDGPARWSPDGEKLLLYTEREEGWFLCITNPDGSDENCVIEGGWNGDWSPDGKKIAFIRIHDYLGPDENYDIYSANADGSGEVRLTDDLGTDGAPKWSPRGDKISFHSPRDGDFEIYLMNPDGSGVTQLTENACQDTQAAWSPDGRKLAFQSMCDGNQRDIFLMNADGSGRVNLTNHPAQDRFPTWSPNGKEILFHSNRDGNGDVYVMKADGSKVRRLTNNPSFDGYMMDWGTRSQAEHESEG